jgi:catechol 2,3-dioxygenase-like lactoylglutathione lyase family enzyme
MATLKTQALSLRRVRCRVRDAACSAEFYAWLLGAPARQDGDRFVIECGNGELILDHGVSAPVTIEAVGAEFAGQDPDGVPVRVLDEPVTRRDPESLLDHIALACADVRAAIRFYRGIGCVVTWSANATAAEFGVQEEPVDGALFAHLSGSDGYLALAQVNWGDPVVDGDTTGPPGLLHVGFAVADLAAVRERLSREGVEYLDAPPDAVGERLYLNDPDGDPLAGTHNVELIKYTPGVPRSGRLSDLCPRVVRDPAPGTAYGRAHSSAASRLAGALSVAVSNP